MAIMNFVSGGYYGKLGNTIGQRWKNKRTVKTYAVPKNPRTEKQQANRGKFSEGTANAQLGQQLNAKAFYWQSVENTSWGLRMKEALRLLNTSATGLSQIPIVPEDFTADINVTKIKAVSWNDDNSLTCEIKEINNRELKTIRILGEKLGDNGEILDVQIFIAKQKTTNKNEIDIQGATKDFFTKTSKFCIVNVPIVQATDLSIFGTEQTIDFSAFDTKIFDLTCTSVSTGSPKYNTTTYKYTMPITFIFANDFVDFTDVNFSFSIYGVKNGEFKTDFFENVSFINQNGKAAVTINVSSYTRSGLFAYPSGSKITIDNFNATASGIIYITNTKEQNFPNIDNKRYYNYKEINPTITTSGLIKNIVYDLQIKNANIAQNGVNIKQAPIIELPYNANNFSSASCSVVKDTTAKIKTSNYKANTANTLLKFNLPNITANGVIYSPLKTLNIFSYSESANKSAFNVLDFSNFYDNGLQWSETEIDLSNILVNCNLSIAEFISFYNNKKITFSKVTVRNPEDDYIIGYSDYGYMQVEQKGTSNTVIIKYGNFMMTDGRSVNYDESWYLSFNGDMTYTPDVKEMEANYKLCPFVFKY